MILRHCLFISSSSSSLFSFFLPLIDSEKKVARQIFFKMFAFSFESLHWGEGRREEKGRFEFRFRGFFSWWSLFLRNLESCFCFPFSNSVPSDYSALISLHSLLLFLQKEVWMKRRVKGWLVPISLLFHCSIQFLWKDPRIISLSRHTNTNLPYDYIKLFIPSFH